MNDRQPCPIHKPAPCSDNCPNSPEARVQRALAARDEKVRADERERIALAIEAGPWGQGMPNGMHREAIKACARIARGDAR